MKTTLVRFAASLVSLCGALVACPCARADSAMTKQALEFAKSHNLPVRKVMAPGPGRPVERLFVPVTKEHFEEFRGRMVEGNGGIGIRALAQKYDPNGHVTVQIEPNSRYLWGKPSNLENWFEHGKGGYLFGVDLSKEELHHFKTQIATIPHCASNCMMWLSDAQVAPNKLLFHELGVSRSKGAGNSIRQKLLRVSNERLHVAGVMVGNLDEFNRMTDAELLGPAHQNGDAEAAHVE